jgi:hypothetical protein
VARRSIPITLAALATLGIALWTGYRSEVHILDLSSSPAAAAASLPFPRASPLATAASLREFDLPALSRKSEPSPQEKARCWELIRRFSIAEIQAALASLQRPSSDTHPSALAEMLFFRWAEMDPTGALEAAIRPPYSQDSSVAHGALTAWMRQDPDAAVRWSSASDSSQLHFGAQSMAAGLLVSQDPRTALDRAAAYGSGCVDSTLVELARALADDETSRQQFLALAAGLKGTQNFDRALRQFAATSAAHNPAAAIANADLLGLSASDTETYKLQVFSSWCNIDPAATFDWMKLPGSIYSPDIQARLYDRWAQRSPQDALDWAAGRSDQPEFIAKAVDGSARRLLQGGWQADDGNDSTQLKVIQQQLDLWQRQQPEAAQAWLCRMPDDLRNNLTLTSHADR